MKTAVVTALAMVAFAANSILCRQALADPRIDAASFTAVRILSGAVMLLVIARSTGRRRTRESRGNWASASALFAYAVLFSFAYLLLDVGTGALILFAFVQATMILWGLWRGERPRPLQWLGLGAAVLGLVALVSPGLTAPSPLGALLMAGSGVAWGVYSLRGRGALHPVVTTTDNFVYAVPMALVVVLVFHRTLDLSEHGVALAAASGALASGVGYVLWYAALRGLTATRAAGVQLTVPVLAALGGLVFLGESLSVRLVGSSALILGGVTLVVAGRQGDTRVAATGLK